MSKKLLLDWSDRKAKEDDHRTLFFPGGQQITVGKDDKGRYWQVLIWWHGETPEQPFTHLVNRRPDPMFPKVVIRGLTDRLFGTRERAMLATEQFFLPMILLAPHMVKAVKPTLPDILPEMRK